MSVIAERVDQLLHPIRTVRILAGRGRARSLQRKQRLPSVALDDVAGATSAPADVIEEDRGLSIPDLDALVRVAHVLDPKTVLELGTSLGNSAANVCRAAPQAEVVTVNALPEQLSGEIITWALERDDIGRVFRSHGYGDRVRQVYSDTLQLDLAPHLAEGSVDLAVIDACHDTEYVLSDFLKVQPYVAPDGVVLMHDTHPSLARHLWASYMACMQLRERGRDVRHLEGTWWAAWRPCWD